MGSFTPGIPFRGADLLGDTLRAFRVAPGSADAELSPNRDILELRSRNLYNNAPFAGAAIDTKTMNVVGTGLSCRPCVDADLLGITDEEAKAWNSRAKKLFELWASSKACDSEHKKNFYQMQGLIMKTKAICGDVFALRCWKRRADSAFGLCYKILEGNRCRNPFGTTDSRNLSMGVEKKGDGDEAVAYHFTRYPIFDVEGNSIPETVRVETFDKFGICNVIHVMLADRPNQTRGLPWLSPVIPMLKNHERYQDSVLIQALIDSMFTVFIKSKASDTPNLVDGNVFGGERATPPAIEGRITTSSNGRCEEPAIELGAGNVIQLGQNEEATTVQHNSPGSQYKDYMHEVMMEMSSRLGMSYEMVLKHWDGNYNAVRAAILESKKMFDIERDNLSCDFCQPAYDAFIHECVMLGILDCPGYDDPVKKMAWHEAMWIGDAPIMLDPTKETQALKMQVDEQFKTREQATLEVNGNADYYDNIKGLANEQKAREESGVDAPGAINRFESSSIVVDDSSENSEEEKTK